MYQHPIVFVMVVGSSQGFTLPLKQQQKQNPRRISKKRPSFASSLWNVTWFGVQSLMLSFWVQREGGV